ncbi:MAG: glutathione S-transferase [Paracoccaceae bacterium]
MKLYHSATSPYVRKVMILIHEAAIAGIELAPVAGHALAPGSMPVDQNPLGKIPALVLDDGRAIHDSRVICRYLDAHAGAGFYPSGEGLWDSLTLESMADGMLDAAVLMVYEARLRPEALQFAPWVEGQWSKIDRSLQAVEERWLPHLSGPLDIGQIALAAALGYLEFRHSGRNWALNRPGLAAWWQAFSARPSVAATVPVG